jgi:hypothetical protein
MKSFESIIKDYGAENVKFFITVFEKFEPRINSRCWGWFHDIDKARQAVKGNWNDMFEQGYYNKVLIEGIPEGMSFSTYEEWYDVLPIYETNSNMVESYSIIPTPKPSIIKNVVHFSF